MITNSDITLYNCYIDTSTGKQVYKRTYLYGVNWQGENTKTLTDKGLNSADNINIYIPKSSVVIENDKRYVKPKKYLNSDNKSDCFTFRGGDIIVKGITDFEIDTLDKAKNIKALENTVDDVITIFTVVDYDFGSDNMKHWKIGGK